VPSLYDFLRRHAVPLAFGVLALALLLKFFWPLERFGFPLGYDVGIYRYLFLKHAGGFPPFVLGDMQPWAYEHPLGLFFFSTILLKLGMPVDWLLTWIWNLMPVVLACALAWAWRRRSGTAVGLLTLLCALLSQAYFDGFASMYWKTLLSLFFYVLALDAIERRSWLAVLWGILCVVTHHQTGLIFGLTIVLWLAVGIATGGKVRRREMLWSVVAALLVLLIGVLWYLPIWTLTISQYLPMLLSSQASGSFPPPSYYFEVQGILTAFGVAGFVLSWKRERGSVWQISALLCFAFIALQLLFFRRFFLQMDFFLLPFAAMGIAKAWKHLPWAASQTLIVALLTLQLGLSARAAASRSPSIDIQTFRSIQELQGLVPKGAMIIALDNQSAPYVLGWLPDAEAGGPGLFSYPGWSYVQWETFITKGHAEREALLSTLPRPLFVYAPTFFRTFYGDIAARVLADPCFQPTSDPFLYRVVCDSSSL
jgi:hypothetical protein